MRMYYHMVKLKMLIVRNNEIIDSVLVVGQERKL
jgi:hypothetical protein